MDGVLAVHTRPSVNRGCGLGRESHESRGTTLVHVLRRNAERRGLGQKATAATSRTPSEQVAYHPARLLPRSNRLGAIRP